MRVIKYVQCYYVDVGTEEQPEKQQVLSAVTMTWSEANEEIAKQEAYNGEYTIEDDGTVEPATPISEDVSWDAMAEAIAEGVNEV